MQFPKLAAPIIMVFGMAACGRDGQAWQGTFEQDGHTVEYETWYHPPGLERIAGNDGISARIAIDGNTVHASGNYIPPQWNDSKASSLDYPQEFWVGVTDQFAAIKPGKQHREEHDWILKLLGSIRDSERILPPDHHQQQALTPPPDGFEDAADLRASQEAGQRMMADYRREHPEEFDADSDEAAEFWGSNIKARKKNRGFRNQIREPGYEYRQRLELWSEHFYITGYDHSATRAFTFKRRAGSDDPWQQIGDYVDACNHGDCPQRKNMKLRQVCDSGAVSDWYVVDGECDGNWMSGHLCNDDTSLQINHAQGIWTGNKCPGHNRGIVPKCGHQFK